MLRRGPRRAALIAVALTVITLFAAPGARAESTSTSPGSYRAKGTATALELNLFGQGITLGYTTADNASDPKATGQGIGALLPGVGNVSDQSVTVPTDGPTADKPEVCGPITLP